MTTRQEYNRRYYLEHKEEILKRNKIWRQNNKKRFNELIYKSRKKKAERLKREGVMYMWHSDKEREILYERRNKRINRSNKESEISNNDNA